MSWPLLSRFEGWFYPEPFGTTDPSVVPRVLERRGVVESAVGMAGIYREARDMMSRAILLGE